MTHGGNIYRYRGLEDFSASISPFEYDFIKKAVADSAGMFRCYPDPDCTDLARRIGEYEGMAPAQIVCGNGAAELIYRIAGALKPKKAVILAPTFTEYEKALREQNCRTEILRLCEENEFKPDDNVVKMIDETVDMIFICDPNNPTGKVFPDKLMEAVAEKSRMTGTFIVCDECFGDFVLPDRRTSITEHFNENCICLKAFTKIFAIPGLRIGYALFGSERIAERVREQGQCWSVSVPAQAAAAACLEHMDDISHIPSYMAQMREYLYSAFNSIGIKYFSSEANFILFRADKGLQNRMQKQGILIRSCDDMALEGLYRIAVRTQAENMRLIAALKECIWERQ